MPEGAPQSTASAAAEQVRTIVAAAEQSASTLEAAARADADRIRAEAERDAAAWREAAGRIAERAAQLEQRVADLVAGVREEVEAMRSDLAALRSSDKPAPSDQVDEELIAEVEEVTATEPDVKTPPEAEEPGAGSPAPEGARVLALKMALDGSPRADTAHYLRENFDLDDPDGLLDEVYAKAGR